MFTRQRKPHERMWSILNGTVVNALAVGGGCAVGLAASGRIPQRFQRIILDALGLITIVLGVEAAVGGMNQAVTEYLPAGDAGKTYGARLGLVMVASLVLGALGGTGLRLHQRIEGLGESLRRRFAARDTRGFAEGFLMASVIFCVGPLTMLGCLRNGTDFDPSYLYIKALLDGFCSIALTASLGVGVVFSIITVLVFQGGLALLAYYSAAALPDLSVQMMNIVGGMILLATALLILEIKRLPVADFLPAIFLAPVIVWLVEAFSPGMLITH